MNAGLPDVVRAVDPESVPCPLMHCHAVVGQPCRNVGGEPRQKPHAPRETAAIVAAVPCSHCDAAAGQPCLTGKGSPMKRIHAVRRQGIVPVATEPETGTWTPATLYGEREPGYPEPFEWWCDKIHCGDMLDVLRVMPSGSVDLVVTSPPYNALETAGGGWRNGVGKWGRAHLLKDGYDTHSDRMRPVEYVAWQQECLLEMMRVLKDDGAILYNHRPRVQLDRYEDHARDILAASVLDECGFALRQVILWDRGSGFNHNAGYFLPAYEELFLVAKPGRFRHRGLGSVQNVWRVQPDRRRGLPALPVDLVRIPLAVLRPSFGDRKPVVLDPFVGSGSVAVAAVLEDWRYIGIDISDEHCRQARNRVANAIAQLEAGADTPPDTTPADTLAVDTTPDTTPADTLAVDTTPDTTPADTLAVDTTPDTTPADTLAVDTTPDTPPVVLDELVMDYVTRRVQANGGAAALLTQEEIERGLWLEHQHSTSVRSIQRAETRLKRQGRLFKDNSRRGASLYQVAGGQLPVSDAPSAITTAKHIGGVSGVVYGGVSQPGRPGGGGTDLSNQEIIEKALTQDPTPLPARFPENADTPPYTTPAADTATPDAGQPPISSEDTPGGPECPHCRQRMAESSLLANNGFPGAYICAGQNRQCSRLYYAPLDLEVFPAGLRWRTWTPDCIAAIRELVTGASNPPTDYAYVHDYRRLFGGKFPWEEADDAKPS